MRVYLVRHGESQSNAEKRFDDGTSPLSQVGINQAQQLAQRFVRIPIDVVLTSDMTRALETANILNKVVHKELVVSELLRERRYPTDFVGKIHDEELDKVYKTLFDISAADCPVLDEESLEDMQNRAQKFLEFLATRTEERVLAVTHGRFLRMLLAVMGSANVHESFIYLHRFLQTTNTGVTICEQKKDGWKLITLNDHAHLG